MSPLNRTVVKEWYSYSLLIIYWVTIHVNWLQGANRCTDDVVYTFPYCPAQYEATASPYVKKSKPAIAFGSIGQGNSFPFFPSRVRYMAGINLDERWLDVWTLQVGVSNNLNDTNLNYVRPSDTSEHSLANRTRARGSVRWGRDPE